MLWETKTNETYHVSTSFDGDLTHVYVYHLPTGIHARGNAKRYSADVYDKNTGQTLAYYRALERLSNKIARHLIRHLPATGNK